MVNPCVRVTDVALTEIGLIVDLVDGHSILVLLAWFARLLHATSQHRENRPVAGTGYAIRWPDVDEDVSGQGLLRDAQDP